MRRSLIAFAALCTLAFSGCTTVQIAEDPINKTWVGRSAGSFFAKYNPPLSDVEAGSTTIYNWRGGYKRIKQANGRSVSVSCGAKITVSDSYVIRDITITSDRPGASGKSYCQELLADAQQS